MELIYQDKEQMKSLPWTETYHWTNTGKGILRLNDQCNVEIRRYLSDYSNGITVTIVNRVQGEVAKLFFSCEDITPTNLKQELGDFYLVRNPKNNEFWYSYSNQQHRSEVPPMELQRNFVNDIESWIAMWK